jgi:hypothetical protein
MGEFATGRVIFYLLEIKIPGELLVVGELPNIFFKFLGRLRNRASSLCIVEYSTYSSSTRVPLSKYLLLLGTALYVPEVYGIYIVMGANENY